jgi:hypothetical protein
VLAIIVMGLSAHVTSLAVAFNDEAISSALLAIASAGFTILTLPVM